MTYFWFKFYLAKFLSFLKFKHLLKYKVFIVLPIKTETCNEYQTPLSFAQSST